MRVCWGIVVVMCMGLPASGVASQQQDPSGPATTAGQAPAAGAPPGETPSEQKKEPEAAPQRTAPQPSTPQPNTPETTEPKVEPQAEPQKQPQPTEPGVEPQPSAPKNEPEKKTDAGAGGANVKRQAGKKRATTTDDRPRKVIIRHGGADEPTAQIVTGMAPEEANRQRQRAEELLKSTDEILRRAALHAFDVPQQETVSQIHNYMEEARAALKEGDISRAHTLAVKADLLANDLTKH